MKRWAWLFILALCLYSPAFADPPGSPISGGGGASIGSYTDVVTLFDSGSCSGYLKSDGLCDTPAGTVTGPATATEDYVVTWGADNTAIKDGGVALSDLAHIASPTFTGTVTVNAPNGIVSDNAVLSGGSIDGMPIGDSDARNGTFLAVVADNVSTAQGATGGQLTLKEASAGGTEYRAISAPDALTENNTYLLPTAEPTVGQAWSFSAPSAGVSTITWGTPWWGGDASTLNFATTGTLTGGIMILDNVASPSAAQCYGSWNETTGAGTITLPAVAAGMSICIGTSTAAEMTIELDGSDHFVLNGLTMADGEAIINTTAEAAGDYICFIGLNATTWKVAGSKGTWTEATP